MSSASPESQPSAPARTQLQENPDFVGDWVRNIMLWRRKDASISVLLAATVIWVAMEIYELRFITLVSWLAMAFVACLFAWGNLNRLFNRETPDLSRLEIREQTVVETATLLHRQINEAIRMVLHLSAESEWFVVAGVVASLYALSVVGSYLDLLTICYIGIVGGLTVPLVYVKNEEKINEYVEKLRMKSERWYSMLRDKLQNIRIKFTRKQIKEKKME